MSFQLHVRGGATLPAGKILGIGKNYEDHRKEMAGVMGSGAGGDQRPPEDPVVFLKPASCLLADGGTIRIPKRVANIAPGTPAGVGAVESGDVLDAELVGLARVRVTVA